MDRRLELLDVFRGLSIISVIFYHYTARLPDSYLGFLTHPFEFKYGYLGVQVFFVISGFCIHLTISRSGSIREFLAKRFARLWPALVVCALITQIVVLIFGLPGRQIGWAEWIGSVFLLNDLGFRWVDGVYWSLLVEVKYYLIFAAAYYARKERVLSVLLSTYFCSVAVVLIARVLNIPLIEPILEKTVLVSHLPWFMLGVAFHLVSIKRGRYFGVAMAAFAVLLGLVMNPEDAVIKLSILCFCVAGFALVVRFPAIGIPYALRWIGIISFPLYLLHQYIGMVAIRELRTLISDTYPRLVAVVLLMTAISYLVHSAVEFRFRSRFEKFFMSVLNCVVKLFYLGKLDREER